MMKNPDLWYVRNHQQYYIVQGNSEDFSGRTGSNRNIIPTGISAVGQCTWHKYKLGY